MEDTKRVNGQPSYTRIAAPGYAVHAYRSTARNRLLIGLPRAHAPGWTALLSALGCRPVPQQENDSALAYWIARTHDPFTILGELHTAMLIEVMENIGRGCRFGSLTANVV